MKNILVIVIIIISCACSATYKEDYVASEAALSQRLAELSEKASHYLVQVPLDSLHIPRSLTPDGKLRSSISKDWTSGFYAGLLWELYRFSEREELGRFAAQWTAFQEKEKMDTHTHDVGFKIYCSFGEGYYATRNNHYKDVIIEAAQTLSRRYHPTVGAIRSWDWNRNTWEFPVIIDNMMNLELLFAATSLSGDSTFHYIATQHALTTLQNHYRPDHSSYHVIDYDTLTGAIRLRHTHQGATHESAWARGQAWGLYGFAMAYRETKNLAFLIQAQAIANFFFQHPNLPKDYIPYWDFDAPHIPDEPRDVSAAVIAAAGLLELYEQDAMRNPLYLQWVDKILATLLLPDYQSNTPPFFLQHSVGSKPGEFEVDVPIIYADYYYVKTLTKRLAIEKKRKKS
jgi:hypothetical protein